MKGAVHEAGAMAQVPASYKQVTHGVIIMWPSYKIQATFCVLPVCLSLCLSKVKDQGHWTSKTKRNRCISGAPLYLPEAD